MPYAYSKDELQRELDMMQNPRKWPLWPRLPLKRPADHLPNSGWLMDEIGDEPRVRPVVHFGRLFLGGAMTTGTQEYDSFEDLIAAGWVVD